MSKLKVFSQQVFYEKLHLNTLMTLNSLFPEYVENISSHAEYTIENYDFDPEVKKSWFKSGTWKVPI